MNALLNHEIHKDHEEKNVFELNPLRVFRVLRGNNYNHRAFRALRGGILLLFWVMVPMVTADFHWSDSPLFDVDLMVISTNSVSFGYSDSDVFHVDLRLIRANHHSNASADSPGFNLNLYPIRRASSDSDSFAFNWFSNNGVVPGFWITPPLSSDQLLRQLDANGNWTAVFSTPQDGDAVIVLNHGWNSEPDEFKPLAQAIQTRGPTAYIYSWAWGKGPNTVSDSNPNGQSTLLDFTPLLGCNLSVFHCWWGQTELINEIQGAMSKSFNHGRRLGNALFSLGIRPDKQYIHFIGHSFGGIVSSEAAQTLKERSGTKVQQLTTLDTPGIPGIADAVKYLKTDAAERTEVIYYNNATALALGATGRPVDNPPLSLLNFRLNALNNNPVLHTNIADWYIESVSKDRFNCDGEPYGFGWSIASHRDPRWIEGLPTGNKMETSGSRGCMEPFMEEVARSVVKKANSQVIGFLSAASWAGQKAELVVDATGKAVKNAVRLTITTGLTPPPNGDDGNQSPIPPDGDNEAYIFQTIEIPADADQMVLDLRFAKVGQGDVLTVSIGDEIVMAIDAAAFGKSDTYTETPPAFIGHLVGQTATVQIALRGTGAGDSEVLIEDIRFVSLTLSADVNDDGFVDLTDAVTMADYWTMVGCSHMEDCKGADINRDNKVDLQDFAELADFWLESFKHLE